MWRTAGRQYRLKEDMFWFDLPLCRCWDCTFILRSVSLTSLGSCLWALWVILKRILRISMTRWEASSEMGGTAGFSTHSYWSFHWTSRQLSSVAVRMDTPPSWKSHIMLVRAGRKRCFSHNILPHSISTKTYAHPTYLIRCGKYAYVTCWSWVLSSGLSAVMRNMRRSS